MIPQWNSSGVLPPIQPGEVGHGKDRAPYRVSLHQVVERLATSEKRIAILQGLLAYRKELYRCGVVKGFQWLNGSFMEQIEDIENRPPNDIDVVTFFYVPENLDQQSLMGRNGDLFDPKKTKSKFSVDSYSFILGRPMEKHHIKLIAYWYSLWSHRRDHTWKGFVQVELDPREDETTVKILDLIQQKGSLL
ncbi:MAG: hypothetical protein HQM12_22060 [SAR324 cluster bacterium]|nr:hypothetical protein [SAR324 cluster bacterium]